MREVRALQDAGARLTLVMNAPPPSPVSAEIECHLVPFGPKKPLEELLPPSPATWRPRRIVGNLWRLAVLSLARLGRFDSRRSPYDWTDRTQVLEQLTCHVDAFWVIGFWPLESTVGVARRHGLPVIYETIDLEPEEPTVVLALAGGCAQALAMEAKLMRHVDGFITVCDSYADYYEERYGAIRGFRRPVVHYDASGYRVAGIRPTGADRRFLFLGHLMPYIMILIEACAMADADFSLDFQGENHHGSVFQDRIDELGLGGRVRLLEPCPSNMIVDVAARYDAGVVILPGENENWRRASSTKLLTYMAAGLAVIGSNTPGIAGIVGKHGNGVLVGGDAPTMWANALEEVANMPSSELDELKQRSLDAAAGYTWERQKPLFLEEFRRVTARSRA